MPQAALKAGRLSQNNLTRLSITKSRLFEQLKQPSSFGEKHSFNVTGDTEQRHVELIIPGEALGRHQKD